MRHGRHVGEFYISECDEDDFVRRALQCRNGIGLAGGGLRHNVVVGVFAVAGVERWRGRPQRRQQWWRVKGVVWVERRQRRRRQHNRLECF